MLRLNQASENPEILTDSLALAEQWLSQPAPAKDSPNAEWHYWQILDSLTHAALELYRFEKDSNSVLKLFRHAAHHYVYFYTHRNQPQPHERRNLWDFLTHMAIAVCFADQLYVHFLAGLESWKYCFPLYSKLEHTAQYFNLLKQFQKDGQFDQTSASKLVTTLKQSRRAIDRRYIAPQVEALLSIAQQNTELLDLAITELLAYHTKQTRIGDFRLSPLGYICLPGLMLAKMSKDVGMNCSISSLYLPLNLLSSTAEPEDFWD